jgi:hypothetical protein
MKALSRNKMNVKTVIAIASMSLCLSTATFAYEHKV